MLGSQDTMKTTVERISIFVVLLDMTSRTATAFRLLRSMPLPWRRESLWAALLIFADAAFDGGSLPGADIMCRSMLEFAQFSLEVTLVVCRDGPGRYAAREGPASPSPLFWRLESDAVSPLRMWAEMVLTAVFPGVVPAARTLTGSGATRARNRAWCRTTMHMWR